LSGPAPSAGRKPGSDHDDRSQAKAAHQLPTFDCLVLSGGGAKGAYGAGVAKAIFAYRALKNIRGPFCYIGASAGALNAYVLAAQSPDALITFWQGATHRTILGSRFPNAPLRAMLRLATTPFSIYPNVGLEKLIRETANIESIKSPLIIAATDYTRGELKAFYASTLIDRLVGADAALSPEQQRLGHFRRLGSTKLLVKALLGSTAIPVFFPPVKITVTHRGRPETGWYIDGGVGNHTPTREAAYFSRYVQECQFGRLGLIICVKQDPPRVIQDDSEPMSLFGVLSRTLEVYHHVHTAPTIAAWFRINREVADQRKRVHEFTQWLRQQDLPQDFANVVVERAAMQFGSLGGGAPRLSAPLLEIEPSTPLGDPLDFNEAQARRNIEHGYIDTLRVLRDSKQLADSRPSLNDREHQYLMGQPIFTQAA
jgi:predicted acylesterase/phospholipase RssA